jgi:hypothetical protein
MDATPFGVCVQLYPWLYQTLFTDIPWADILRLVRLVK